MKSGLKIRELRESRTLNIGQLAQEMGVSPQTITNWEENSPFPKGEKLDKLCKFFDVDPNFFEVEEEKVVNMKDELVEEYRSMLEFMKTEMSKLTAQNSMLIQALTGNGPKAEDSIYPSLKKVSEGAIQEAA